MSLTITLSPETERRIRERAERDARTPESVAADALDREFPPMPDLSDSRERGDSQALTPAERAERFLKLVEDVRADIAALGPVPASALDKRLAYEDE